MKQAIRYFSLGLLLSALLLYGYQFFNKEEQAASFSNEELVNLVEDQGYHVLSKEEYIRYTLDQDTADKDQPEESEKDKTSDKEDKDEKDKKDKKKEDEKKEKKDKEKKKDKVVKAKITVKEGTYSPQIAEMLKDEKIIKDDKKFAKYLDDNDYSDYLQLGTFKVSSDMSKKELAKTLTTYPGD